MRGDMMIMVIRMYKHEIMHYVPVFSTDYFPIAFQPNGSGAQAERDLEFNDGRRKCLSASSLMVRTFV